MYPFDGLRDLESSVATLVSVTESSGDGAHRADMLSCFAESQDDEESEEVLCVTGAWSGRDQL